MNIENNLDSVKNRILSACKIANRDSKEITLIAVSKFQSVDKIETAINLGQQHFGENRSAESGLSGMPFAQQRRLCCRMQRRQRFHCN